MNTVPALRFSIFLTLGIIISTSLGPDPRLWFLLTLLFSILSFVSFKYDAGDSPIRSFPAIALSICLGGLMFSVRESEQYIPSGFREAEVEIVGEVTGIPEHLEWGKRFVMRLREVGTEDKQLAYFPKAIVRLTRSHSDTLLPVIEHGFVVKVVGRLMPLQDERNPGEFSPRQFYEAQGITALCRVKGYEKYEVLDSNGATWLMKFVVLPVRKHVVSVIDETVGGEEGEFLKGILIGERAGLSAELREAFANSGTAHVLAVSGSNVAVVAGVFFVLFEFCRVRKRTRVVLTCLVLVVYMFLTGSQPPVVRATIMAVVLLVGTVVQEKSNPLNSLGVAAAAILIVDPGQLFDVGFQLSFAAVIALLTLYPILDGFVNKLHGKSTVRSSLVWLLRICTMSAVATLGTLPLTAMYFEKISIVGVLTNIFVVPAVGISVVLGFCSVLAGSVSMWMAHAYSSLNSVVLWLTIKVAEVSGAYEFATLESYGFRWLDAIPFYLTLLFVMFLLQRKRWSLVLITFLVGLNVDLFVPRTAQFSSDPNVMRVTMIDVGQGDATLVEFPGGRNMLIDAGPRTDSYDAGRRVVVPFLKRRGINAVDLLVITHPHADHLGGAHAVFEGLNVRATVDCGEHVESPMFAEFLADQSNEPSLRTQPVSGNEIVHDSLFHMFVLHPPRRFARENSDCNLNDLSVVLKLCYGRISFLFTGDAEEAAELAMVSTYGDFLRSDVLKVGHHGSSTSTSPEFLDAVRPRHATISVAQFNKFNHPSEDVIELLSSRGVEIARTDEEGAIIFETDGLSLTKVNWR